MARICRTKPYQRRFVKLSNLLNRPDITHIEFVETATDPANKERLFRHLQAEKKEGVVFKRLDAPYTPGRPNSGGNQLKHKFYATCSAVVAKINDKRSVELRLLNGKGWIPCGNVTIPPNFKVPAVGEVVEMPLPVCLPGEQRPVSAGVSGASAGHRTARMRPLPAQIQGHRRGGPVLINRSKVKEFALEMAKHRAHKFTRVGSGFFIKCEGEPQDSSFVPRSTASPPKAKPSTET